MDRGGLISQDGGQRSRVCGLPNASRRTVSFFGGVQGRPMRGEGRAENV